MRSYVAFLFSAMVRNKLLWACPVVVAGFMLLPFLNQTPMYEVQYFEEEYQRRYESLSQSLEVGEYDTAPADFAVYLDREHTALRDMSVANNAAAYYDALADYSFVQQEETVRGYLSGIQASVYEVEGTFFRALSKRPNPKMYEDASQLPAIEYLSSIGGQVPSVVWMLPCAAAIAASLGEEQRGRLLCVLPTRATVSRFACVLLIVAFALVCVAISAVLVFAFVAAANGIGDALYPVVLMYGDDVVEKTAVQVLKEGMALHILGYALMALCAVLLHELLPRKTSYVAYMLSALALLTSSIPMMEGLITSKTVGIASLLPTTYLAPTVATGALSLQFLQIQHRFVEVEYSRGLLVLGASVAMGIVMLFVITAVMDGRRASRKGGDVHA